MGAWPRVMGRSIVAAITTVTVAGTVLLAGFIMLPPLLDLGDFQGPEDSHARIEGSHNFVGIAGADSYGSNETVVNSRGNAIKTTGADDSYVTANGDVSLATNGTWSVQQAIAVDESATSGQHVILSIGDPDLLLLYDNSTGTANWSAVWFTSTDSYRVNVSAPSPTARTHVYAQMNGSNFTIWRNETVGESATIDGEGAPTGNLTTAGGCPCWLEETRAWDDYLNASQRNQAITQPVAPLEANRTLRIMYDKGSGSEVLVFWTTSQTGTVSNATWVDGYDGKVLSSGGLVAAGDYDWRNDGPALKATVGGALDGAPVAWVDYTKRNQTHFEIQERVVQALLFGGIVLIVMMAGIILSVLREL